MIANALRLLVAAIPLSFGIVQRYAAAAERRALPVAEGAAVFTRHRDVGDLCRCTTYAVAKGHY